MPSETFFNLSQEKREKILGESKNIFIEKSYTDVSIREIAKRCEISVGSFYQYFTDKDDLYLYMVIELEKRIQSSELKKYKDVMFAEEVQYKIENLVEGIDEQEIKFNKTCIKMPEDVLRKFYFLEYLDMVRPIFSQTMEELKKEGKVRVDLDTDFFVYMYTTSLFNMQLYFREQNILEDENKCFNLKKEFLRNILPHGIFNK